MKTINIDLGSEGPDYPISSPPDMKSEKYYPRFSYSGDEEIGLPKEGTMVIRYREVAKSEREGRDGEESYTCEIEVREIVSVDGADEAEAPAKNRSKESEDALDNLAKNRKKY